MRIDLVNDEPRRFLHSDVILYVRDNPKKQKLIEELYEALAALVRHDRFAAEREGMFGSAELQRAESVIKTVDAMLTRRTKELNKKGV
jgi:hypothetical protein